MVVQRIGFYAVLVAVSLAFGRLLLPYSSAILWAVILAILFYPMQQGFARRLGGRSGTAAALSLVVCVLVVVVPALLLLGSLISEGNTLYVRIARGDYDFAGFLVRIEAGLPEWARTRLAVFDLGSLAEWRSRFGDALSQGGRLMATTLLGLGQNAFDFVIGVGLMLYLLFFFFRDGLRLAALVRRAIPLSDEHAHGFLDKFAAVVRATIKGNIVIAGLQGGIGGVAFWAVGIEGAALWGVVIMLLSLLPAVGAVLVWTPAVAYLAANDRFGAAAALAVVAVLVGLIDNVLRPILVGKDARLPDYLVLVSTIGGLSVFGVNGFVLGPVVAALFVAAWDVFMRERAEA
jgi:predicted PurR-regulated permease PerM